MPDYISPSWTKITRFNYGAITDQQIAQWEQDTQRCEQANEGHYKGLQAKRSDLLREIEALCGKQSSPYKALQTYRIAAPRPFDERWKQLEKKIKAARQAQEEHQAKYLASVERREQRRADEREQQRVRLIEHEKRHEAGVKAAETRKRNEREREEYVNSIPQSD